VKLLLCVLAEYCQYYVRDDGFRVMAGDLLGISSENSGWNLIGFDEDLTQRTFLRGRRLINGSMVFADLPRVWDVVDDFTQDTSPTRFSVAVQLSMDTPTTPSTTITDVVPTTVTSVPLAHSHSLSSLSTLLQLHFSLTGHFTY